MECDMSENASATFPILGPVQPSFAINAGVDWDQAPQFGRRETILRALHHLEEVHPGPVCIVETGTLRNANPSACNSDGWSTIAWGWYACQTGGHAYTIDIDPGAMEVCRRVTTPYSSYLSYLCADSLQVFAHWVAETENNLTKHSGPKSEIHLLYLDSFDYFDHERSEAHHLAEAQACLPLLAPTCLVLIDDTSVASATAGSLARKEELPPLRGKGSRAAPFLIEQGFHCEWCEGGQLLLSRSGSALSP